MNDQEIPMNVSEPGKSRFTVNCSLGCFEKIRYLFIRIGPGTVLSKSTNSSSEYILRMKVVTVLNILNYPVEWLRHYNFFLLYLGLKGIGSQYGICLKNFST